MPLDPTLFGNFQAPDIMGGIDRGLRMSDQIQQRREERQAKEDGLRIKNIIAQNTTVGEDGSVNFNPNGLRALASGGYYDQALQLQKQMQEQQSAKMNFDAAKAKNDLNYIGGALGRVKDQNSWNQEILAAKAKGIDVSRELGPDGNPIAYDPKHVQMLYQQTDQYIKHLDSQYKQAQIGKLNAESVKDLAEAKKTKAEGGLGKLTDAQSNAITFGKRAEAANKIMANLSSSYDRSDKLAGLGSMLPNVMRSSDAVQQEQAEKNFLTAVLRKESGASISEGELKTASELYFPRAGDDPQTLQNKTAARQQAIEGLKAAAGKSYESVPLVESKMAAHPMDSKAVEWAKSNPNDPRSSEILRVNGVTP